jgi:aconitate hydratase
VAAARSAFGFPTLVPNPKEKDGDVAIAAITSCTNTSNPSVMIGAGLLARNAVARGLKVRPGIKTRSRPARAWWADYLERSGLQASLDALGFQVAGYGCMTCMGNSGPLPAEMAEAIEAYGVTAVAVLSGNRNFEGAFIRRCARISSPRRRWWWRTRWRQRARRPRA